MTGGSLGDDRHIEEKQNELRSYLDLHLRQFDVGFYQPQEPHWANDVPSPREEVRGIQATNEIASSPQTTPSPAKPTIATSQNVTLETSVIRANIPVVPTLYPGNPAAEVIVHDQVSKPLSALDLQAFNEKMDEMIGELKKSNTIAGEVRDKLISELNAGRAILNGPKPDRKLVELLLIRPLKYIGEKAASITITALVTLLLAKLSGMF